MNPGSIKKGQIFEWKLSIRYRVVAFWFLGHTPVEIELERLDNQKRKAILWDNFLTYLEDGFFKRIYK